ncbi:MAG: hypothetical protein IJ738_02795 [Alphaproteobacteria bacterium]|nr:hypothetical protein [Alphaproteobacteria bacterium]MBR1756480.1 hypothetical protein [Alphaproteobacteria bacterium]
MKKILLTVFIFFATITTSYNIPSAWADSEKITIGGYEDYPPFGWLDDNNRLQSVFGVIMDNLKTEINKDFIYRTYKQTEENWGEDVANKQLDIFLGAYNQSDKFERMQLMYPAILSNPVTFFMLTIRTGEVKTPEDLKRLKGLRYSGEVFTDFVENRLSELNLEPCDSFYDIFEKLFTRKADYVVTGYYFGMIEAIKSGLKNYIAISKQPLWNIPVFVGVSETSPHKDRIIRHIARYFNDKQVKNDVNEKLQDIIRQFERQYAGVVPPTFDVNAKSATEEANEAKAAAPLQNNKPTND